MDKRQLIVDAGKKMLHSGFTVETWGNISLRDPETGLIYITPSGMPYDSLLPEDVLIMNSKCEIVEGCRKPTIEAGLHIGIYNRRPDINAVVHTHPIYSQVFACLHQDIPPAIDEAAQVFGGTVRCAKYGLPGSKELAENTFEAMGDKGYACLLANHGAVCAGDSIPAAFKACTVLEMTAQIYYMALTVGKPQILSDENVAIMREFAKNRYGQR